MNISRQKILSLFRGDTKFFNTIERIQIRSTKWLQFKIQTKYIHKFDELNRSLQSNGVLEIQSELDFGKTNIKIILFPRIKTILVVFLPKKHDILPNFGLYHNRKEPFFVNNMNADFTTANVFRSNITNKS